MADNVANAAMLDVSKNVSQMNDSINNLTKTVASQNKENPDGLTLLTQSGNDRLEELIEQLKDDIGSAFEQLSPLIGSVSSMSDTQKDIQKFQKDGTDILEELMVGQQEDSAEMLASPAGKNNKKNVVTTKPSGIDILKDLSANDGLGFVALWWKLDEINNTLKEGGDGNKKKGGNVGDIFKGLLEGATGIGFLAVALIAFAGALVLFQFVEWGPALAGMVAFGVFTIGMIKIAKQVAKDAQSFVDFAKGALLLSAALAAFGIALLIAGGIFTSGVHIGLIDIPAVSFQAAFGALASFAAFELGAALLANKLEKDKSSFRDFAQSSLLLAAGLAVFALSLSIASYIFGNGIDLFGVHLKAEWPTAGLAIGYFTAFMIGMGIIARTVGDNGQNFVKFAAGSVLMTVALVTFGLAISFVSGIFGSGSTIPGLGIKVQADPVQSLIAIGEFLLFIGGVTLLAKIAGENVGTLIKFTLASMLMSVSLGLFGLALAIPANLTSGKDIDLFGMKIPGFGVQDSLVAMGMFLGFVVAFSALAVLANSFMAQIALFSGVASLMSLSLVMFGFGLAAAVWAVSGGDMDLGPLGRFSMEKGNKGLLALEALGVMVLFTAAFAALGVGLMYAGPFALLAAGILIPMAAAIILMAQAMSFSAMLANGGHIEWAGKAYDFPTMAGIDFKTVFTPFTDMVKALIAATKDIGVFAALGFSVKIMPLAAGVIKVGEATQMTLEVYKKMKDEEGLIDGGMEKVFMPFIKILDALVDVAGKLDKNARKSFEVVVQAMVPISDTLKNLVNIIGAYAKFSGPDGQAKMDTAVTGMDYIMVGASGGGFVGIMNGIASHLKGMSQKALVASQAMPSITEALSALVNLISSDAMGKLMNAGDMEARMTAMNKMGDFFEDSLIPVLNKIGKKEKNINAAIPIFGTKEDEGLWGVMTSLAGIMKIDISTTITNAANGITKFIDSIDNLSSLDNEDIDRMNSLSTSIPDFSKAIANFTDRSKASEVAQAITEVKVALQGLSGKSNPFREMNDAINDSAKSLGKLNDRLDDTISKMKKLGKETTNAFAKVIDKISASITTADIAANKAQAAVTGNAVGSIVETILQDWNAHGVPVRGSEEQNSQPVRIFAI